MKYETRAALGRAMRRIDAWYSICGMVQLLDDCRRGRYSGQMLVSARRGIEFVIENDLMGAQDRVVEA